MVIKAPIQNQTNRLLFSKPKWSFNQALYFLLPLVFSAATVADEYFADWIYDNDCILSTTAAGANVSENVLNFPILIRLDSSNFIFSQAKSNGEDIRFAKSDGTRLSYEVERWDAVDELAEIWVLIDTVFGGNNTQKIKMYWGNSSAVSRSGGTAVFDTSNGYIGVWHLSEDPAGGASAIKDATENGLHATPVGSMTNDNLVDGMIGKGHYFDGINDGDSIPFASVLNTADFVTLTAWINADAFNSYARIISRGTPKNKDPWNVYALITETTNKQFRGEVSTGAAGSNICVKGAKNASTGIWYYMAFTYDNKNLKLYRNGARDGKDQSASDKIGASQTTPLMIGKANYNKNHFTGIIDEATVSNVARSGEWIKLCYENQRANQTLVQIDKDKANSSPVIGSSQFKDPPFLQISQNKPGYRHVKVQFRIKDNESDSVTIGNFGYSPDSGITWYSLPNTSPVLERNWSSNLVPSAPDFEQAEDHSILFKTNEVPGGIFTGQDLAGVMLRLTAAEPMQNKSDTALSKPFRVDNKPPEISFEAVATPNPRPSLSGSSNEIVTSVELEINNNSYSAEISDTSLYWTLADSTLPRLDPGTYTVVIRARDQADNAAEKSVENGLTINPDLLSVSVTPLNTAERSPEISGTVSDTAAKVSVSIGEETYPATVGAGGIWRIPSSTFKQMSPGTYDVKVSANSANGAVGQDNTTGELVILDTVPAVTINDVYINNHSPEFSGTIDMEDALITLEILSANQGVYQVLESLPAAYAGKGIWRLDSGRLKPLPESILAAAVSAVIPGGTPGTDTASVTIDLTPPVVQAFTPVSSSKIVSPEVNWSQNEDLLSVTLSWMDCETGNGTCDAKDTVLTGELLKAGNHRVLMPEGTLSSGASYTVKLTLIDKAGNAADTAHHQVTLYPSVILFELPENSKIEKKDLQIRLLDSSNYPAGMLAVGPGFLFEANGDNQNWTFGEPVVLRLKLLDAVLDEADIKKAAIYKSLPEQTGGWTRLPSTLKDSWIETETDTLSSYIAAVDILPPRMRALSLKSSSVAGADIGISAEIRDNITNPTAYIHVNSGGGENSLIPMHKGDLLSRGIIPGSWSSKLGLWYTIKASDGADTVISDTVDVRVEISEPLTPGDALQLKEGSYQMFSIPLQPEQNTVSRMLNDDFGEFNTKRWRLYSYEKEFTEMEKDAAILPGRAYWIRTRDFTPNIDVDEVKISTLPVSRPFAIPLNAGWNCIANPFFFPITPANLRTSDGEVDQLWERSGGDWLTKADIAAVEPWRGYVIWNGKEKLSDSLFIFPGTHSSKTAKYGTSGHTARISLSVSDGYFQDGLVVLGFGATGAQNGKDNWDCVKPGIFSEPLELNLQVDWDKKTPYLTDIREALGNGQSWNFSLHLGKEAAEPTLSFTGLATLPAGVRAVLLDRTSGQSLPLSGKPLPYPGGKQKSVNTFEVAVGNTEYLAMRRAQFKLETTRFELGRISPNPFSRRTVIYYSLPWNQNRPMPVRLRIIDTKGRIVRTLVDASQTPGRHSTIWTLAAHGTPIPSGSYFCLLTAGKQRAVKKLVVF